MEELPKNNLLIVMPSLCLVLFLAALDQTIIATALPTIAGQFNATPSQYSWIVTSYQLAMTLLTPVNGRVSDIVGRKPMLYVAIVVFTVFSALCGAAQNVEWLIVCRALQGLGGGTIMGLVSIIVSDIVPLEKRGSYQGFMGASWGVAAVVGPILGGAFTHMSRSGWRWCFYINLPTAGVAFVLLVLYLKLNKPRNHTFDELRRTFDFLGLFLIMVGSALLIVGFSFAADHGFGYTPSIALIVVGGVLFCAAIVNCLVTKRTAVIPARLFKTRTTLFYTIASTLHAAAFIPCNVLLPQFFQGVHGADALQAGIQLLPFAIFVSWSTVVAGQIQSRLRIVRPVTWFGYAVAALGFGILYGFWDWDLKLPVQHGTSIVPAVGLGLSLQSPMLILQAAMPLKDMAAVTSAWVLTRSIGGSVGVSVYTAVLNSDMRSQFAKVQDRWGGGARVPTSAAGYEIIHALPDGPMKEDILRAFADSFKPCWIMAMALLIFCLTITVPTRAYSLNRPRGAAAKADSAEGETPESDEARLEAKVAEEQERVAQGEKGVSGEPISVASTPTAASNAASTEKERAPELERGRGVEATQ
ncbi:MFS general substrate transporter [Cutaneotrichosporon oleaginosum]|uniref:MFS general substrate transporter n=1 Tax=Cutaneotrichosporon oleaginosum TaxID=879819 RepID=A0A0J0XVN4_9TREE|nr:MFS general substrate transporter [Cutaneotrichosporon oleaginosum]KLT45103.1 MFS general substrate transporter [Cutaneotrichosporon oleaginosum]TXT09784.1 hypothetical protein COLE_03718 [Cutaneotrichosporon oleaginosum]